MLLHTLAASHTTHASCLLAKGPKRFGFLPTQILATHASLLAWTPCSSHVSLTCLQLHKQTEMVSCQYCQKQEKLGLCLFAVGRAAVAQSPCQRSRSPCQQPRLLLWPLLLQPVHHHCLESCNPWRPLQAPPQLLIAQQLREVEEFRPVLGIYADRHTGNCRF